MALLTPLTLDEARALGTAYGLEISVIEPLALGSVNSNFRLTTEDGALYFARLYEEQALAGAEGELRLLQALAAEGVPVAGPLETKDGRSVIEHRGKPFALFPWVEGDWLCLRRVEEHHCRAVGEALARVHLATPRVGPLPVGRFRPEDMLARLDALPRDASERLAPDVRRIRDRYAVYVSRRDAALPSGICHGDLFRDNVLFRGDRVAALLDFESVSFGSFVYDVAVTVLAWCYRDALIPELARALGSGYARVRRPTGAELAALDVEAALACLRFATTRITDFELRRAPNAPPGRDYRRFLQRLAAVERGALEPLREALGT
ncbi:MAG: homoserine kinase [Pseudomonadota bacterium]|nr:MAG: homoserine kinase [Pseudomonadota bacterium]